MERRQLEYFVAVSREGSVAAAAEVLHVTQPALSQAIKQLEKELGCELFHRLPRGMRLTAAGEALLDPAKQIFRDFSVARASVDEVAGLEAGTLDIMTMPGVLIGPLSGWISTFRHGAPKIQIRIQQTENADVVAKAVRSGDFELGFMPYPDIGDDLVSLQVGQQSVVALFPPGWKGGTDGVATDQDLLEAGLIAGPYGTAHDILRRASKRTAVPHRPIIEVDRRDSALSLVLAGAGASFLPEMIARMAEAAGAVVREFDPPIRRDIYVLHRSGPLSPAARLFKQILAETDE